MTSLVFENFNLDYYSYRFGLGFRLGLGLGLGLRLGLRVSFFRLYYKMSEHTERVPSLLQKKIKIPAQESGMMSSRPTLNKNIW